MTLLALLLVALVAAGEPPQSTEPAAPAQDAAAETILPGNATEGTSLEPSEEPVAIPYTEAPTILNRDAIVAALIDGYPRVLRDAGIGGTVRVYFYIDAEGTVRNTRIAEGSGHQALDAAALRVAGVYRFSPAMNGDEPTGVWIGLPITFRVRSTPQA